MEKIFAEIAKNNNTTKEQVKKDITKAIEIAIKNSKGNADAEKFWNEILEKHDKPTVERVIKKIADEIKQKGL